MVEHVRFDENILASTLHNENLFLAKSLSSGGHTETKWLSRQVVSIAVTHSKTPFTLHLVEEMKQKTELEHQSKYDKTDKLKEAWKKS